MRVLPPNFDAEPPVVIHRLQRILNQIRPHLIQFVWIAANARNLLVAPLDLDAVLQLIVIQRQRRFDSGGNVRVNHLAGMIVAGIGFQREHDFRSPLYGRFDGLRAFMQPGQMIGKVQKFPLLRRLKNRQKSLNVEHA